MKLILLIFVLQLTYLSASSKGHGYGVAKQLLHARKEQLIKAESVFKPSENPPAGPFCQKLVAYVIGTFQRKDETTPSFTAQFEVRLDADLKKKRIVIESNGWNETFSKSSDFNLDFYYSGGYQWCDIKEDDCSASFSKNVTTFRMDLNKRDGTFFHLLYFPYFNNSFPLSRPYGTCTKHQLDGLNDEYTPDLSELSICVCCDEYKPDALLICPEDPWHDAAPTNLPPAEIVNCTSITAYYNGVFSNNANGRDKMKVEFQVRMKADDDSKKVYYMIDHWNEDNTISLDIRFFDHTSETSYDECVPPVNTNCSFPYVTETDSYIFLRIDHYVNGNYVNEYNFLDFPLFENEFKLYNATGQCTKYQPKIFNSYDVNQSLYDFCMCCGDYNPDPSLNCPPNPWANHH